MKYEGVAPYTKDHREISFLLPSMEKDNSADVKQSHRSSRAIMKTDLRSAMRIVALHKDDDSESEDEGTEKVVKQAKDLIDLCPSWMGQVFQVQYILKLFIKHEGFFESGSGAHISLPLRILATPRTDPSSEPWRVPDEWNPYPGTNEPTYVYLANPEEKPEYMTKFIDRNWAKWEANLEPVLLAAQIQKQRSAEKKTMGSRSKSVGAFLLK